MVTGMLGEHPGKEKGENDNSSNNHWPYWQRTNQQAKHFSPQWTIKIIGYPRYISHGKL